MGTHYQSWKPDTCGCILHQRWEDPPSGKQEDIKIEFFAIEEACAEHQPLIKKSQDRDKAKEDSEKKKRKDAILAAVDDDVKKNMDRINAKMDEKLKHLSQEKREARKAETVTKIEYQQKGHKQEVLNRYEDIFEQEFALDEEVYTAAFEKNKQKNVEETLRTTGKVQQT